MIAVTFIVGVVAGGLVGLLLALSIIGSMEFGKLARRNGWSRAHHSIYKRSIGALNKIVNAHALDDGMDPLLQRVVLPESLRAEADKVITDYRKEIDA